MLSSVNADWSDNTLWLGKPFYVVSHDGSKPCFWQLKSVKRAMSWLWFREIGVFCQLMPAVSDGRSCWGEWKLMFSLTFSCFFTAGNVKILRGLGSPVFDLSKRLSHGIFIPHACCMEKWSQCVIFALWNWFHLIQIFFSLCSFSVNHRSHTFYGLTTACLYTVFCRRIWSLCISFSSCTKETILMSKKLTRTAEFELCFSSGEYLEKKWFF